MHQKLKRAFKSLVQLRHFKTILLTKEQRHLKQTLQKRQEDHNVGPYQHCSDVFITTPFYQQYHDVAWSLLIDVVFTLLHCHDMVGQCREIKTTITQRRQNVVCLLGQVVN